MSRTVLLAHATAWRLYDKEFRSTQNGVISITLNSDWAEPKNPESKLDQEATDLYLQVIPHLTFCCYAMILRLLRQTSGTKIEKF